MLRRRDDKDRVMQIPVHRRVADRYQLGDVLGRGGMGTVWRAHDDLLGRPVAVKVIEPVAGFTEDEPTQSGARALREARAASRLNHPGTVTVYDIVQEDGRFSIVMELIEAPNLAELVQQDGPLPPARVAGIGAQLLDVLDFAHQAGIVHRDIKPANVMVLPGDRVKLTDFGIASLRGDPQLTSSGMTMGSPRYMSPEQAAGEPAGPAADLWGLGATLYFAVEGRPPFERPGTSQLLAAILTQSPDPMRLAGQLRPALTTLLVRRADERPGVPQLRRLLALVGTGDDPDPEATAEATATAVPVDQGSSPRLDAGDETDPSTVEDRGETVKTHRLPAGRRLSPVPAQSQTAGPAPYQAAAQPYPAAAKRPDEIADRQDGQDGQDGPTARVNDLLRRPSSRLQPRRRVSRAVAALSVLSVGLAGAVLWLGIDLRRSHQTAARQPTTVVNHQPAAGQGADDDTSGTKAEVKGAAADALSPSSPDAPATGLGQGAIGRDGLRTVTVSRAAPAGQLLAPNLVSATNSVGGYRIGVPSIFQVAAVGPTTFADLNDETFQSSFEVHSYRPVDPRARLRQDRELFARDHAGDGYRLTQAAQPWTYAGNPAVAWEFTWTRNGKPMHAREVAFRHGGRTYTVLYRSLDVFWLGGGSSTWVTGFEQSFAPIT